MAVWVVAFVFRGTLHLPENRRLTGLLTPAQLRVVIVFTNGSSEGAVTLQAPTCRTCRVRHVGEGHAREKLNN